MGSSFTKLGMDKIKNGTLKRWNCDATNFSQLDRYNDAGVLPGDSSCVIGWSVILENVLKADC